MHLHKYVEPQKDIASWMEIEIERASQQLATYTFDFSLTQVDMARSDSDGHGVRCSGGSFHGLQPDRIQFIKHQELEIHMRSLEHTYTHTHIHTYIHTYAMLAYAPNRIKKRTSSSQMVSLEGFNDVPSEAATN